MNTHMPPHTDTVVRIAVTNVHQGIVELNSPDFMHAVQDCCLQKHGPQGGHPNIQAAALCSSLTTLPVDTNLLSQNESACEAEFVSIIFQF